MSRSLIFVKSNTTSSLYRDHKGMPVLVPHRFFTKYDLDGDTLRDLWSDFTPQNQSAFLDHLPSVLNNPADVDSVFFCEDCDEPGDRDSESAYTAHSWRHGEKIVCENCVGNYWACHDCDDYFDSTTTTLCDLEVCESCRDNNWNYCEDCDGYYSDGDDCGGDHAENCDCEAPHQRFQVGDLKSDDKTMISLPAGTISDVGVGEIARLLRNVYYTPYDGMPDDEQSKWYTLSYDFTQIGEEVQRKDGNYAKRLSRFAYKTFGIKIPADMMTKIGNLAAQHSQGATVEVAVTRDLNQGAEYFAHEDSCWWQSYAYSRCTLKSNGGFGLRSFDEDNGSRWADYVSGRAWVMPLKEVNGSLTPTTKTDDTAVAFVIFNGYGDLNNFIPARIMAQITGKSYRKIGYSVNPMYVNNESGYLVAAEDVLAAHGDSFLSLHLDQHADLAGREQREALVTV